MKSYICEIKREHGEYWTVVIKSDSEPTEAQMIQAFKDDGINDNPDYSKYRVVSEIE